MMFGFTIDKFLNYTKNSIQQEMIRNNSYDMERKNKLDELQAKLDRYTSEEDDVNLVEIKNILNEMKQLEEEKVDTVSTLRTVPKEKKIYRILIIVLCAMGLLVYSIGLYFAVIGGNTVSIIKCVIRIVLIILSIIFTALDKKIISACLLAALIVSIYI